MDVFYFILRYTPFWAVPLGLIGFEFAYVYWLKSYKKMSLANAFVCFVCILFLSYYYWAGGPDKSISTFKHLIRLTE